MPKCITQEVTPIGLGIERPSDMVDDGLHIMTLKRLLVRMEPFDCDIDDIVLRQTIFVTMQQGLLTYLENSFRCRWLSFTLFPFASDVFNYLSDDIVSIVKILDEGTCQVFMPSNDVWLHSTVMSRAFHEILNVCRHLQTIANAASFSLISFREIPLVFNPLADCVDANLRDESSMNVRNIVVLRVLEDTAVKAVLLDVVLEELADEFEEPADKPLLF